MDHESYRLKGAWGPRLETAPACAAKLALMLEGLASVGSVFAHWYRMATTRAEGNEPFCSMPPDVAELRSLFEAEEDLSLSAWNGIDGPRGCNFTCRAGSKSSFPFFSNRVEMLFHYRVPENADLLTVAALKPALLSVVAAWDPDWASVYSWNYLERFPRDQDLPPFRSGWMTYLSPRLAPRISPPPTAVVDRTPAGGLLMLATEEPFTIENPNHLAAADAIQACLAPLQP